MKREARLYLQDIIDSITKIQKYTANMTYEEFEEREMVIDAVIRNLEIIGEATAQLPFDIKEMYPDTPWYQMKGMRNIIAHEYFGVRLATIWETICVDLPKVLPQIKTILSELE